MTSGNANSFAGGAVKPGPAGRLNIFKSPALAAAVLAVLILAVFWRTLSYDFVNYDDLDMIAGNLLIQSLAPENLEHMFKVFHPRSYYPVRLVSFAVDYAVWGENPMGYHFSNLLIHTANAMLLFALFLRLAGDRRDAFVWGAFICAAVFAVHPCTAETTVWTPGREELLMLFFGLTCLHCLLRAQAGRNRLLWRALAAWAMVFSCLSNVMGAGVFFAACWLSWTFAPPGGWKKVMADVWLLAVIGAGAALMKILAQSAWDPRFNMFTYDTAPGALAHARELIAGGAAGEGLIAGLPGRVPVIAAAAGQSLLHVLWPASMPFFHPPPESLNAWAAAGLALLAVWAGAVFILRKNRIAGFGLAWFGLALLSASQVIPNDVLWRADRYLYMPLAGLALAAGWAAAWAWRRLGPERAGLIFLAPLCLLGARSLVHMQIFADGLSFHQYAEAQNPDYYLVQEQLAGEYLRRGMWDEALEHYLLALENGPDKNYLWHPILQIMTGKGQLRRAAALGRKAVAEQPDNAYRRNFLGAVYSRLGLPHEAAAQFKKAVELAPDSFQVHHNMGLELVSQGKSAQAVHYLRRAQDLHPKNERIVLDLGKALERSGQKEAAMALYRSLAKYPGFSEVRGRLLRLQELRVRKSATTDF